MDAYRKKITAQEAWLRKVERETPIMRIMGLCDGGWEEMSDLGPYIRWAGRFQAQIVQRPPPGMEEQAPQGMLVQVMSYVLILPAVAAQWLATYHDIETVEGIKPGRDEKRTGVRYRPHGELGAVRFVLDLSLKPAAQRTPADRGYEFAMRITRADERYDPMADLTREMGDFKLPFATGTKRMIDFDEALDALAED